MARRVFFSFHYEQDIWRASQVRNCWVTQEREAAGFWDSASWESVKRRGEQAIKRWINSQLQNTSVTVVLIGPQTASRDYVIYEISRSHDERKGLLGIYIHNMKNQFRMTASKGTNPFSQLYVSGSYGRQYLSDLYPTYDWVQDDGYRNIGSWVEAAARRAGR